MGQTKQYPTDRVEKTERLSRIVLSPKDIDPVTGYPKDSFLSLRQDEEGVSFLRFDFMGEDAFFKCGHQRAALYNGNSKKKKYTFAGWMEGIAEEIEALFPGRIAIKVNAPDTRPEHVNIVFLKNGDIVKGIVTDAEILDIIDEVFQYLRYVRV